MSEEMSQSTEIEIYEDDDHHYFKIDRDRMKGDRRSDGQKNADFFVDGESARIIGNVRVSQRVLHNERLRQDKEAEQFLEPAGDGEIQAHDGSSSDLLCVPILHRGEELEELSPVLCIPPCPPRGPDKGLKCAGRARTSRLLWLHEFFIVYGNANRKHKYPYVYQALQFLFGAQLPEGVMPDMNERQRREIWVLGVSYLPADHVRMHSTRQKGYLFHQEHRGDDADKALYGQCPEIVRVENSLKWHAMSMISQNVPRVVHADDVKTRRFHVAGRKLHYVCGIKAIEGYENREYLLSPLPRRMFTMYPEEKFGMIINSPSIMWEHVEDVFNKIRQCMSSARQGTSSASFTMSCSVSAYAFWKVHIPLCVHCITACM